MLRERLLVDPHNTELRAAIAEIYRSGGHPDQAARYVFAFGEYDARTSEPYLQWLAATGADETRIRHLSVLPDDVPIPESALDRIGEIRAAHIVHEPWATISWVGGAFSALLAIVTVLVVYVVVALDGDFARPIAMVGGAGTVGAFAVGALGIAGSSRKSGDLRAAAVSGFVSLIALALCALALLALHA